MFVLDTNTLIYFFKGEGNVAATVLTHQPNTIAVPTIVVYELEVGIAKSTAPQKRRQQLQTLLNTIVLLPFDLKEAQAAARIRATLEQQGTPIGHYDTLIAATALAHGATLVTHNTSEFQRVPGLQLQDWY